MARRSIKISADIPDNVPDHDVARYVEEALESYGGGLRPENPLFASLRVQWVSMAGIRYERPTTQEVAE